MSYNHMRKQTCQWVSENEHSFFITSLTLCNIFLFKACDGQSKEEDDIAEPWVKLCFFFLYLYYKYVDTQIAV